MESSFDVQSQNLALVTLKERCHFLKQQLKDVDAENIKLKVQIAQSKIADGLTVIDKDSIITEVETLRKEKNQLVSQVNILATENNNMWSRLSRLTVVNRNLTRRFTKISDKLEKYGISSLSESETDNASNLCSKDYRKNLEEMSIKLINNIKLEKSELERQYAQMVELHQTESDVPVSDLVFSSVDIDDDSMVSGVRKHAAKLNQLKHSLKLQQLALMNALSELKTLKEDSHLPHSEDISVVPVNKNEVDDTELTGDFDVAIGGAREGLNVNVLSEMRAAETVHSVAIQPTIEDRVAHITNEQVCPMCGRHIPGPLEVFYEHVSDHFDNDDSPSSLTSFVHVPNQ